VRIRTWLFAAFLVLAGAGFFALVRWILDDLRPRFLATMEESMVDTATLFASLLSSQLKEGEIQTQDLRMAFDAAQKRRFAARIYEVMKTQVNTRVYVTDRSGVVLFDSDNGRDEGKDYYRWNDVLRTLRGEYGARTSLRDRSDPFSDVLYVASPIVDGDEIIGVLTVCRPTDDVALFMKTARRKITLAGVVAAVAVVGVGMLVSVWITRPIEKLTRYAKAVRDGKRVPPPKLGGGEIGTLGVAFEEMRRALEGKQYVEDYVQTLTHQMKSPLSAIRGAAELLEEDMAPEQRRQFLENLRLESGRIHDLVERMLQLSALENRDQLRDVEKIDLYELVLEIRESLNPVLSEKGVRVDTENARPVVIRGERFLIRQALANLLQNAVDFSDAGGEVRVTLTDQDEEAEVGIWDDGPGIPDYALERVFDRFYSLQRPDTGKKSSGLGLAFVREVAHLHGGKAALDNRPEGGAVATLTLPKDPTLRSL